MVQKKLWLTVLSTVLLCGALGSARATSVLTNIFGPSPWATTGITSDNGFFETFYTPALAGVPQSLSSLSNVNFGSFNLLPTFISGTETDGFTMPSNTGVTFFFDVTEAGHTDEYEVFGTINSSPTALSYDAGTGAGSSDSAKVTLYELLNVTTSTSTMNTSVIDPGTGNHSLNLGDIYVDTVNYGLPNPLNGGTSIGGSINAVPEMGTSAGMVAMLCGSGLLGLITRKRAARRV